MVLNPSSATADGGLIHTVRSREVVRHPALFGLKVWAEQPGAVAFIRIVATDAAVRIVIERVQRRIRSALRADLPPLDMAIDVEPVLSPMVNVDPSDLAPGRH